MIGDYPIGWPGFSFPIQPFQPSFAPLPNYDIPSLKETLYITPIVYPYPYVAPIGCICPPGANKECQRADCPHKGLPK